MRLQAVRWEERKIKLYDLRSIQLTLLNKRKITRLMSLDIEQKYYGLDNEA